MPSACQRAVREGCKSMRGSHSEGQRPYHRVIPRHSSDSPQGSLRWILQMLVFRQAERGAPVRLHTGCSPDGVRCDEEASPMVNAGVRPPPLDHARCVHEQGMALSAGHSRGSLGSSLLSDVTHRLLRQCRKLHCRHRARCLGQRILASFHTTRESCRWRGTCMGEGRVWLALPIPARDRSRRRDASPTGHFVGH